MTEVRIVNLGRGEVVIDRGTYEGASALFIVPAKQPGDVGEKADREGLPTDRLTGNEVVLTFPNDGQALMAFYLLTSTGLAALAAIAVERRRQIELEGFRLEHDDQHAVGELAAAAACYAKEASKPDEKRDPRNPPPKLWPWVRDWWKPTYRRRDLIKAGALLVAEIERLDRDAARAST